MAFRPTRYMNHFELEFGYLSRCSRLVPHYSSCTSKPTETRPDLRRAESCPYHTQLPSWVPSRLLSDIGACSAGVGTVGAAISLAPGPLHSKQKPLPTGVGTQPVARDVGGVRATQGRTRLIFARRSP